VKEGYDSKFIFLLLSTLNLRQFAGGSAQPLLNQTILKNISVKIPQLQVQEEISSVIFSLTDKIQLNLQMNQTLEEMAMTLYKHWFVDFGPFQDGEFVESELGMIPKGWEVSSLKEFANILMGQSPKSEFYNQERKGLPFHQGVKDFGIRFPVHTVYCTQELRIANKGDILLSVRAPVGRINIANNKLVIGRGLSALHSKSGHNSFLLYTLKRIFVFEDQYGSGTVFNSINKKDIEHLKFIRPSQEVLDNFEKRVSKFDSLIESNTKEIEELQELRDYLLPRLLSGEIDLSQAEKQVEEVL
jgi:type I restriction enzyme, S subunit